MYSLTAILKQTPVAISNAVFATFNFLVIAGWVDLSAEAVAALNTAIVAILGLFVANAARSNADDQALKGIELGKQLGQSN